MTWFSTDFALSDSVLQDRVPSHCSSRKTWGSFSGVLVQQQPHPLDSCQTCTFLDLSKTHESNIAGLGLSSLSYNMPPDGEDMNQCLRTTALLHGLPREKILMGNQTWFFAALSEWLVSSIWLQENVFRKRRVNRVVIGKLYCAWQDTIFNSQISTQQ